MPPLRRYASRRRASRIVRAVALVACASFSISTAAQGQPRPDDAIARIERWVEDVLRHAPGVRDAGPGSLSGWSAEAFHQTFPAMVLVAERVREREREYAPSCGEARSAERPHTRWRKFVDGARDRVPRNEQRALMDVAERVPIACASLPFAAAVALLHGDTAIFAPYAGAATSILDARLQSRRNERPSLLPSVPTVVAADGQYHHTAAVLPLLDSARAMLYGVHPSPEASRFVREWYAAVSAQLLREGNFGFARVHLEEWRASVPDDERRALDEAQFEETLASPRVQTEIAALVEILAAEDRRRASGGTLSEGAARIGRDIARRPVCAYTPCLDGRPFGVGSESEHLRAAERLLRRLLDTAPELVEARVRLARVSALLGRHEIAASLLSAPPPAAADRAQRFYWQLFLGASLEALGRSTEALQAYEAARTLYPSARSAGLAAAQLLFAAGAGTDAEEHVRGALVAGDSAPVPEGDLDPYADYYSGRGRDAARLLQQMWTAAAHGELQ